MEFRTGCVLVSHNSGVSKKNGQPYTSVKIANPETYETETFFVKKELISVFSKKLEVLEKGEHVEVAIDVTTDKQTYASLTDITSITL